MQELIESRRTVGIVQQRVSLLEEYYQSTQLQLQEPEGYMGEGEEPGYGPAFDTCLGSDLGLHPELEEEQVDAGSSTDQVCGAQGVRGAAWAVRDPCAA